MVKHEAQKMFSINDFFSVPKSTASCDLVTFNEQILKWKTSFFEQEHIFKSCFRRPH